MRGCERTARLLLAGAAVAVIALGVNVSFGSPPDCPHAGIECPMIWDPVICNDGVVYSNKCVAKQNCAKGCVAYDGGPIPAGGERDTCDRPKVCPKLWAPVICDDGKVYPNECWAQKKCATGCVPYEEWMFPEGGARGNCEKPKFCPLLWAPVICDDGKVYANECWAQKKCATGCVPYDEGFLAAGGRKKPGGGDDDGCPRLGFVCPMIYDPVICDDGQIYSNSCVAWVWCATGCEPLGPGPIIVP